MGGNALKQLGVDVKRFTSHELETFYKPVALRYIRQALGNNTVVNAVPSYRNKETHGDLDVVLCVDDTTPSDWKERIVRMFHTDKHVSNGKVLSIYMHGIQVDVIAEHRDHYDFALAYYSYNDLGNLLGRVARANGLKLSHKGLFYDVEYDGRTLDTIKVTGSFREALKLLGYEPIIHDSGFDSLEDIFRYVVSSPRFDFAYFDLEHRNNAARLRDRKRPTYTAFLKWCHEYGYDNNRDEAHSCVVTDWIRVAYRSEISRIIRGYENHKYFKTMFNGRIVSELTGLEGKELGRLMKAIKNHPSYTGLYNGVVSGTIGSKYMDRHVLLIQNQMENNDGKRTR